MISRLNRILHTIRADNHPFRLLVRLIFRRLPFDIGRLIPLQLRVQNYRIRFHSTSALAVAFWYDPHARADDFEFVTDYLKPTDIYLDIGANIGTTFIPAAKVVTAGQAIGFEPHPKIFAYLQENVALNQISRNVVLHNCALGSQQGQITFSDKLSDDQNQILVNDNGLNVPINRLDDLTTAYDRIDLVKVDVEGYEKFVFAGAADTLAKTTCIYYEVCDAYFERFGYTTHDLLAILAASGFKQFQRHGRKTLRAIDSQHLTAPEPTNLIAIRDIDDFIHRTSWRIENQS